MPMGSIDRYVFRTILSAFVLILLSLTAVIWTTQILQRIDIITNQGQTTLAFLRITGLLVPILMLVIAPIAMLVAIVIGLFFARLASAWRDGAEEEGAPRRGFLRLALLIGAALLALYSCQELLEGMEQRIITIAGKLELPARQPGIEVMGLRLGRR